MKGHPDVIAKLNELAAAELAAVAQYQTIAEHCRNWGYVRLADAYEHEAREELGHFGRLVGRVVFLEGAPVTTFPIAAATGDDVPGFLAESRAAEGRAVANYSAAVKLCFELNDHATRTILEQILADEDRHVDWTEAQMAQVRQMGLPAYLQTQVVKG